MVSFTIIGEPASKANSRQLVTNKKTGKLIPIKSGKALNYVIDIQQQAPRIKPMLSGPLVAHITIWYASEKPDLDESLILDALQGIIYKNDRQVREKHVYHGIDRKNPRADVRIEAAGI